MTSDSYANLILDQLDGIGQLEARRMFGGHGLYLDAVFFGIVHDETLYFKTNETSRERYRAEGMEPFRPTERQTLVSYYRVPPEIVEDREALGAWAREAAAAASAA